MKFVYLKSCKEDLLWMRKYYNQVFPDGKNSASKNFETVRSLLVQHNYLGVEVGFGKNVRKFQIPKTPFSVIYRIQKDRIEVLRILDERALKN